MIKKRIVFGQENIKKMSDGIGFSELEKQQSIKNLEFVTLQEFDIFKDILDATKLQADYCEFPFNSLEVIDEDSKWGNETFQVIALSCGKITRIIYHFNHKGTSYMVFLSLWKLICHFTNGERPDWEFETEGELDNFLEYVDLMAPIFKNKIGD